MEICKVCGAIAEWNSYYGGITCTRCGHVEKPKVYNFDRFKALSKEELVGILKKCFCPMRLTPDWTCKGNCQFCWTEWMDAETGEWQE